jgi:hypothetical protein
MPVDEADDAVIVPDEGRKLPPSAVYAYKCLFQPEPTPKCRRNAAAKKAPLPDEIQYVITFEQKYLPHPGAKLVKKRWPGVMFSFSRRATLEAFQAELLNRLSHFDRKIEFTIEILDCTFKIKSKVTTPQLLFPQAQYDFMISKCATEVNLLILQKVCTYAPL